MMYCSMKQKGLALSFQQNTDDPKVRILLAEDSNDFRLLISDYLKSAGFEVEESPDGAYALALLASNPYDMVITDVKMPKADGFEIIRYLKKKLAGVPVFLMTSDEDQLTSCVTAQLADRIFIKPFHPRELVAAVSRHFSLA